MIFRVNSPSLLQKHDSQTPILPATNRTSKNNTSIWNCGCTLF